MLPGQSEQGRASRLHGLSPGELLDALGGETWRWIWPSSLAATKPPNSASKNGASKTSTVSRSTSSVSTSAPTPSQYPCSVPACRAAVSAAKNGQRP